MGGRNRKIFNNDPGKCTEYANDSGRYNEIVVLEIGLHGPLSR